MIPPSHSMLRKHSIRLWRILASTQMDFKGVEVDAMNEVVE